MATSILEQYRISDLLEWYDQKKLIINPEFQRRNVWTTAAESFLIDTILRQLPIPKLFIRTKVDLLTRGSIREVVDGQQRLRAIIKFANNTLVLDKRAKEFKGLTYDTLTPELKQVFLSYAIGVEQLINASDDDVLEVFARLNSYTVSLKPAEKRHAGFQGDFKWVVHELASQWNVLWEKYKIVSVRERVRMADDSFMAELFGVLLEGVKDGGEPSIDKLYAIHERTFTDKDPSIDRINELLSFATNEMADALDGPVSRAPHFLMFFAALAHAKGGIPVGDMEHSLPERNESAATDLKVAIDNIRFLSSIIESDAERARDANLLDFWKASTSTTQRISSRRIRMPVYYRALLPIPLE